MLCSEVDSSNTPKYTHLNKMESQNFSEVKLVLAAFIYLFFFIFETKLSEGLVLNQRNSGSVLGNALA